jgi:heme-degrading monooxygenase HmoA
MIVRIAHFQFPDEKHRAAAEVNGSQRVWPALASQPGAHAIYYGRSAGLEGYSISVWEDHAKGEAAGAFMNSRPLLPGHSPDMLPTPDAVGFYEVVSALERDRAPAAGRIGYLRVGDRQATEAADEWARTEFAPMLEGVAGLCQAYLLRPEASSKERSEERVSLTFWESPEAMDAGGRAIGAWQAADASEGRAPAYVATEGVRLSDLLIGRIGWQTLAK